MYGLANIKSAKKRVITSQVRADRNKAIKSKVKTYIKKVDAAVAAGDKAAAEAAGSAAAVPVVGWINAVAAITAIMSAMAAVPKFADGGIIGGNSFIGDNMIARVNSGEMILNNRQQRNLFNLLDGKGGTSVNAGGEVKLRIEGRDLVGVINSQTSKTSKYK